MLSSSRLWRWSEVANWAYQLTQPCFENNTWLRSIAKVSLPCHKAPSSFIQLPSNQLFLFQVIVTDQTSRFSYRMTSERSTIRLQTPSRTHSTKAPATTAASVPLLGTEIHVQTLESTAIWSLFSTPKLPYFRSQVSVVLPNSSQCPQLSPHIPCRGSDFSSICITQILAFLCFLDEFYSRVCSVVFHIINEFKKLVLLYTKTSKPVEIITEPRKEKQKKRNERSPVEERCLCRSDSEVFGDEDTDDGSQMVDCRPVECICIIGGSVPDGGKRNGDEVKDWNTWNTITWFRRRQNLLPRFRNGIWSSSTWLYDNCLFSTFLLIDRRHPDDRRFDSMSASWPNNSVAPNPIVFPIDGLAAPRRSSSTNTS